MTCKDTGGTTVGAYTDATKTVTCSTPSKADLVTFDKTAVDATARGPSRSADAIDVTTQAGANSALDTIDSAIDHGLGPAR